MVNGCTAIYLLFDSVINGMADGLPKVTEKCVEKLTGSIRDAIRGTGCKGAVIGLSGGIDSAVVTKLCVNAIGAENVLCIFMPSRVTIVSDYRITSDLCSDWGFEYKILEIQPAIDSLSAILTSSDDTPLDRGNIAARCRMIVLYNLAKKYGRIVLGTSNESEIMMGYFTKFGDGACDIAPLSGMYKTHVRQIAKIIGVPNEIIQRPPTAGLWEGQTDEDDMGITYDTLDMILYSVKLERSDAEISKNTGVSIDKIAEIRKTIEKSEHKRMPPIQLGFRFS